MVAASSGSFGTRNVSVVKPPFGASSGFTVTCANAGIAVTIRMAAAATPTDNRRDLRIGWGSFGRIGQGLTLTVNVAVLSSNFETCARTTIVHAPAIDRS